MLDRFFQIKRLVVETVIWAERELGGRTGAEKKDAVVKKVMQLLATWISLPWYASWAKNLVAPMLIGRLVDLATGILNFMTDWNFTDVQLTELQIAELACTLDSPLSIVADFCYGNDLGEKIGKLYHKCAVSSTEAGAGKTALPATRRDDDRLSPNLTRREITCRCGCGFDSIAGETVILFQAIRDFIKRPIIINSGCRCPEHNDTVRGAPNSPHICGAALDMRVNGWSNRQFGEMIKEAYKNVPVVREHLRFCERVNSASGAVVHADTGRVRKNVFGW